MGEEDKRGIGKQGLEKRGLKDVQKLRLISQVDTSGRWWDDGAVGVAAAAATAVGREADRYPPGLDGAAAAGAGYLRVLLVERSGVVAPGYAEDLVELGEELGFLVKVEVDVWDAGQARDPAVCWRHVALLWASCGWSGLDPVDSYYSSSAMARLVMLMEWLASFGEALPAVQ